jgi:hypothetical protein
MNSHTYDFFVVYHRDVLVTSSLFWTEFQVGDDPALQDIDQVSLCYESRFSC